MNKSRMKNNVWSHVRLRPVAKRFTVPTGRTCRPLMTTG